MSRCARQRQHRRRRRRRQKARQQQKTRQQQKARQQQQQQQQQQQEQQRERERLATLEERVGMPRRQQTLQGLGGRQRQVAGQMSSEAGGWAGLHLHAVAPLSRPALALLCPSPPLFRVFLSHAYKRCVSLRKKNWIGVLVGGGVFI